MSRPAPKTIITCAVTGNHTTRARHPDLPVTPREIARAAVDAARAGAVIAHIHVRDPETGEPSTKLELYAETVDRIRSSGVDVLINLTTGPGSRFLPASENAPDRIAVDRMKTALERVQHVLELRPDLCSLDLNTMWFGGSAVINGPNMVCEMAGAILASGVKPELEVFDSGDRSDPCRRPTSSPSRSTG